MLVSSSSLRPPSNRPCDTIARNLQRQISRSEHLGGHKVNFVCGSASTRVFDGSADQIAAGFGGLAAWQVADKTANKGLRRGGKFFYGNAEP